MSSPPSRLRSILGHLTGSSSPSKPSSAAQDGEYRHQHHLHTLSPTFFLPRAAAIEPDAEAIYHVTVNDRVLRRSYGEFADRARGLAWYLKLRGFKQVGILAPNTPAFLESIFGIAAAGAVIVPVNYRLKHEDIAYIFDFAEVDCIIVDAEFVPLLDVYRKAHPNVPLIVDTDTDATEGELSGPFDAAVLEGLQHDRHHHGTGGGGWDGLLANVALDEDGTIAIPFTSGTTSRPKGVIYTHRGAYLAALANVIESGLNCGDGHAGTAPLSESTGGGSSVPREGLVERCRYLWTLPMFHAMGWTFPWAITAVRGTHVCLRRIDYPLIWRLLREEDVTHFNAAPTVNTLLCSAAEAARLPRPVRVTVAASPPTATLFERMTTLNLHPVHVYGLTETYGPITKSYYMPAWDALKKPHERFAKMARQGHGFITSLPVRVVRTPKEDEHDGDEKEKEDVAADDVLVDVRKDGKEIGEIVFFGNICTKGYYKDPAATRKLFAGGGLHSGDLAVWHPDGSVQILDRAKDIIISGGENISSVALESMLVEHPDVLEAGVVSVPDSRWGERPKAYLTAQPGKKIDPQALIDWCRHQSNISRFMVPREVEVVQELPKTSTGKIRKNVLREWAKQGAKHKAAAADEE